jgi:hypothetical protein
MIDDLIYLGENYRKYESCPDVHFVQTILLLTYSFIYCDKSCKDNVLLILVWEKVDTVIAIVVSRTSPSFIYILLRNLLCILLYNTAIYIIQI